MYYILVLTENKRTGKNIVGLYGYHNIKIWSNNALLDSILHNVQKRLIYNYKQKRYNVKQSKLITASGLKSF
jgi:hypothetical protein